MMPYGSWSETTWVESAKRWSNYIELISPFFNALNATSTGQPAGQPANPELSGKTLTIIMPNVNNLALAAMALRALQTDLTNKFVINGTMTVLDVWKGNDLETHDTVAVNDELLDVNGKFRVLKITKRWSASTGEVTEVELTNIEHLGNAVFLREEGIENQYEQLRSLLVDFASHSTFGENVPKVTG